MSTASSIEGNNCL